MAPPLARRLRLLSRSRGDSLLFRLHPSSEDEDRRPDRGLTYT